MKGAVFKALVGATTGALIVLGAAASTVSASIGSISPASATIFQGQSTTAQVNVQPANYSKTCLISKHSIPHVTVTFSPGAVNPPFCQAPPYTATMRVSASESAQPGSYPIRVIECADTDGNGQPCYGSEPQVDEKTWTLTVKAAPTPTPPPSTPPPQPPPSTNPPPVSSPPTSAPPEQKYSVSCSPSRLARLPGQSATSTCTVSSQGGFSKPVGFSCASRPPATSCTFNPQSVTPRPNRSITSRMTLRISADAQPGQFDFQVVGRSGSDRRTAGFVLAIVAPPPPAPQEAPPAPPASEPRVLTLNLDPSQVVKGGRLVGAGTGCDPNSPVQLFIDGQPPEGTPSVDGPPPESTRDLEMVGEGTAGDAGEFEVAVKLPSAIAVGTHSLIAECGVRIEATVKVVAPPRAPESRRTFYVFLTVVVAMIFFSGYRIFRG